MRIIGISGSLRAISTNSALLDAAFSLAPPEVHVSRYRSLELLPAFNPDVEMARTYQSVAVADWRRRLASADAVLFSSPEYAHGLPGTLKNALDWVVGSGELVGKRVGVLSASSASRFAHPQLIETLAVMSATIVPGATRVIDARRHAGNLAAMLTDPEIAGQLRAVLDALQVGLMP